MLVLSNDTIANIGHMSQSITLVFPTEFHLFLVRIELFLLRIIALDLLIKD